MDNKDNRDTAGKSHAASGAHAAPLATGSLVKRADNPQLYKIVGAVKDKKLTVVDPTVDATIEPEKAQVIAVEDFVQYTVV